MRTHSILAVDDEADELQQVMSWIRSGGHQCFGARSAHEARRLLVEHDIDVMITDIHLSEVVGQLPGGMELLRLVKKDYPNVLPLAMSKDPDVATFDQALAYGALQFVSKPIGGWGDIGIAINLAFSRRQLQKRMVPDGFNLPVHLKEKYPDGIVVDPTVRRMVEGIIRNQDMPVVITGETGTGKEEIANLIRREREVGCGEVPFVAVNCAHLRTDLAHSALFGHRKGSFTGATESTSGYIGEADRGILFLDEIHTLPKQCQQDLLRVLNDGTYSRVGDTKVLRSKFQLVVASTKDLEDQVEEGHMLLDLVSRLVGCSIHLKPLRQRREIIPDLVALFFAKSGKSISRQAADDISSHCAGYYWQGNIRMLIQALRVLTMNAELAGEPYSAKFLPDLRLMHPPRTAGEQHNSLDGYFDRIKAGNWTLEEASRAFDRVMVGHAIDSTRTIGDAARLLGISRATIDVKRKRHGLA